MAFAFLPLLKDQRISDARTGIGITKNVLNAHKDGLSVPTEFAFQSATIVPHMTKVESVQPATTDTLYKMVNVKSKTYFVKLPMPMEHVNHATTDTFFTENNVFLFQNLPALPNIMPHAAQKNSRL